VWRDTIVGRLATCRPTWKTVTEDLGSIVRAGFLGFHGCMWVGPAVRRAYRGSRVHWKVQVDMRVGSTRRFSLLSVAFSSLHARDG
jgi:hypothetical protein